MTEIKTKKTKYRDGRPFPLQVWLSEEEKDKLDLIAHMLETSKSGAVRKLIDLSASSYLENLEGQ